MHDWPVNQEIKAVLKHQLLSTPQLQLVTLLAVITASNTFRCYYQHLNYSK